MAGLVACVNFFGSPQMNFTLMALDCQANSASSKVNNILMIVNLTKIYWKIEGILFAKMLIFPFYEASLFSLVRRI